MYQWSGSSLVQVMVWHDYVNLLPIGSWWLNKLQLNFNQNTQNFFYQEISFKNVICQMTDIFLGFNELRHATGNWPPTITFHYISEYQTPGYQVYLG